MHLNKIQTAGTWAIAEPTGAIAEPIGAIAEPIGAITGSIGVIAAAISVLLDAGCAGERSLGRHAAESAAIVGSPAPQRTAEPAGTPPAEAESESGFVDVARLEPSIRIDLRYATANNFTGKVVYPPSARCYLRGPVARRLQAVQQALRAQGLSLKVYDCYRPLSVQRHFFSLVPDERYVANPQKGSRHNRGAAVDLTLTDDAGVELAMPTAFDDFSERAHRSYQDLPADAIQNRARLEAAMTAQGFVPMPTEWWHFDDAQAKSYRLADVSFEALLPTTNGALPSP